ncbi:pilus assembly protein N-terminal domain-containing protein [Microbacterium suwonense]|uniref:Lipoprotein LpqH n=1 Tax=Microbacterium suwonense TaxID=683047 RepID=A0ABM8FUA4_9MICO|nr:pilus assembly protein N-terminal domain-containing protein [Microbacterium suwonense]BDZ39261.1 hypothetical protein GCM10025863_18750 [Microbacterium suwonense]
MRKSWTAGAVLGIAAILTLSGCFGTGTEPKQEPATIVKTIDELQGAKVQLAPGESLGVDTAEQDAVPYAAMILDGSIASYEPSRDGSQIRIIAVAPGTTDVLLGDPDQRVDDVSFTLTVTQ